MWLCGKPVKEENDNVVIIAEGSIAEPVVINIYNYCGNNGNNYIDITFNV